MANGQRLLLAYARSQAVMGLVDAGVFDAVVVATARQAAAAAAGCTVLLEAVDAPAVQQALAVGAAGVLVRETDGAGEAFDAARSVQARHPAFVVLTEGSSVLRRGDARVRWAETPAEAQEAFTGGARVVVCDVAAALAHFRPMRFTVTSVADRPVLVMLPGMLGDASVWDGVAGLVADVVIPAPARIDLDESIGDMAESVLAAAPDRFFVCGHSLGGIVALEMLRRDAGRVRGAVLANSSARPGSPAQQAAWSRWRQRAGAGEFEAVAAELARSTLPPGRRHDVRLVEQNEHMARAVGPDGFARQLAAQITRPDSRGTLRGIDVPVVVVSSEEDEVCPPDLQRELADCFPAAESVNVPGAGHMLPLEQPAALAAIVRDLVLVAGVAAQ